MAVFACDDCGEEMDEGAVSCTAVIPPAEGPETTSGGTQMVITATCPGCGIQRAGVFSANDLTAI